MKRALTLLVAAACSRAPAPPPVAPNVQTVQNVQNVQVVPTVQTVPTPPVPVLGPETLARISRRAQPAKTLVAAGLAPAEVAELSDALDGLADFRRLRPGDVFAFRRDDAGRLASVRVELSAAPLAKISAVREGGRLVGHREDAELHTEIARVEIVVRSSVWQAFVDAREDPELAVLLADVLAWDVDFYNDPRPGDRVRVLVERRVAPDGKVAGYGAVLAAEYAGLVTTKKLFAFTPRQAAGAGASEPGAGGAVPHYYDDAGRASRRAFLKSPLKYAHVTSKFGSRFHPVLKYVKQHEGVDYAASTGTPVWAVGDGTVVKAGWAGACGKAVELRHANGFTSVYCHLSRLETHAGARVSQKSVIGLSGATGRVTGPHLHYALKKGGRFVNPLAVKFPPGDPVPRAELAEFEERRSALSLRLAGPSLVALAAPPGAR